MSTLIANRLALLEDLEGINKINEFWFGKWEARDFKNGFLGSLFSRDEVERLIIANRAVVATIEDRVVGYSLLNDGLIRNPIFLRISQWLNSHVESKSGYAYLAHIAVDIDFLNKKVNKGLLEFVRHQFKDQYRFFFGFVFQANAHALNSHLQSGWRILDQNEQGALIAISTT